MKDFVRSRSHPGHVSAPIDPFPNQQQKDNGSNAIPQIPFVRSASSSAALRSSSSQRSLTRRKPSFSQYQTTSITKHYEASKHMLTAYDHFQKLDRRSEAYAMGMQYITSVLIEIPKHGYFNSPRHERERMQSALDAVRVTHQLQELSIKLNYDHTEGLYKLYQLALKQVEEASQDQFESERKRTEEELRNLESSESSWIQVCEPLLTCSDSWTSVVCPPSRVLPSPSATSDVKRSLMPSTKMVEDYVDVGSRDSSSQSDRVRSSASKSRRSLKQSKSTRDVPSDIVTDDTQLSYNSNDILPSPRPPRPPRASNPKHKQISRDSLSQASSALDAHQPLVRQSSDLVSLSRQRSYASTEELQLEKALYLSGLDFTVSAASEGEGQPIATPSDLSSGVDSPEQILPLEVLSSIYHDDFDQLIRHGRIRFSFVDTYQGRESGSINGCTVIAPLLCMHHLLEEFRVPDQGLNDTIIKHVIDEETPNVLQELRSSLGLSPQAFLIPSDSHEYLINSGQLCADQFVTVTGGNILDDDHITSLLDVLKTTSRRLAACFFFHEHVVAILQLRRNEQSTEIWYDIIDGLPMPEFVKFCEESDYSLAQRLSLTDSQEFLSQAFLPKTSRTRCLDLEALRACLRWYACSKFTIENMHYIDSYPWEDMNSDFDPRVFQAFVWGSHMLEI